LWTIAILATKPGVSPRGVSWKPNSWSAPENAKKMIEGANNTPSQPWIRRIVFMCAAYAM
jgi:hypothetical protein